MQAHAWLGLFAPIRPNHLLSSWGSGRQGRLLGEAFLTAPFKMANDSPPNITPSFPLLVCINPNTAGHSVYATSLSCLRPVGPAALQARGGQEFALFKNLLPPWYGQQHLPEVNE